MILTIIAFIIVLGLLVIAHEFGHFIMAKKSNVKVLEFAIGFPPKIASFIKGETAYVINAIPIGGYVKMLGELEHSSSPRAFENQKPGKRFSIAVAGVIMNLVLAWIILTIGFSVGMSPIVSDPESIPGKRLSSEVIIAGTEKDSPAEAAGIKSGDILLSASIGGESFNFSSTSEVTKFTTSHMDQLVNLQLKNDSKTFEKQIKLSTDKEQPLGVAMVLKSIIKVVWYKAPYVALRETYEITKLTVTFLGSFFAKIFVSGKVSEEVGGPVAIYVYTGLAVKAGIMALLQFIAILSVNLALVNILPFPSLDGGRIVFIILEKLFGKKVIREQIENIIHTVGFVILILLILAITYKDIVKLF